MALPRTVATPADARQSQSTCGIRSDQHHQAGLLRAQAGLQVDSVGPEIHEPPAAQILPVERQVCRAELLRQPADRAGRQRGVGPGFDYQIDDKTIAVLNHLNRASEEESHHNQNILELGVAREICPHQFIKAAVDVGLDGQDETPNFAVKLMWDIEWMWL